MARTRSKPPYRNHLLAALPAQDLARLRPHLEPVDLPLRWTLSKAGDAIKHLYFIETGMVSLVAPLDDGALIEIGVIGAEGIVGAAVLHGDARYLAEAMVQCDGSAMRIRTAALRNAADESRPLLQRLLLFSHALHIQVAQSAACNGRHSLQERLARWLLMTHDRAGRDELPLTHDFLGMMLGTRRAGITVAVGALKAAGMVRNSTGRITVLDRSRLEMASCECYRIVTREYARLLH